MRQPAPHGRCYACDRRLGVNPYVADTRDAQFVFVGSECFKNVRAAGSEGWQPPKGGPRLYPIPRGMSQDELAAVHVSARSAAKS